MTDAARAKPASGLVVVMQFSLWCFLGAGHTGREPMKLADPGAFGSGEDRAGPIRIRALGHRAASAGATAQQTLDQLDGPGDDQHLCDEEDERGRREREVACEVVVVDL